MWRGLKGEMKENRLDACCPSNLFFTCPLSCVGAHVWCVCVMRVYGMCVLLFSQPPSLCIAWHVGYLLTASRVLLRIISLFTLPSLFMQPESPYRFLGLCPVPASLLAVSFVFLSIPLVFIQEVLNLILRKAQVISLVRMPSALPPDFVSCVTLGTHFYPSFFPFLGFFIKDRMFCSSRRSKAPELFASNDAEERVLLVVCFEISSFLGKGLKLNVVPQTFLSEGSALQKLASPLSKLHI